MLKVSVVVRKHIKKEGGEFYKATAKGKFLPLVELDDNTFYTIRFHTLKDEKGKSEPVKTPERTGIYEIAVPSHKDIWLDQREEMLGKNVVHIRSNKIIWLEPIPTRELDK